MHRDSIGGDPVGHLGGIKANVVTPLDIRDPMLRHEPTDVANGHAEVFGDLFDVQQGRKVPWVAIRGRACH